MRVAYLVSQYPGPSLSFIRREVQAVRECGIDIHTFSIRDAGLAPDATTAERASAADTFCILRAGAARYVSAHVRALVRGPLRYAATLAAAFRHRVPGVRSFAWSFVYFAEAIVLADELQWRQIDLLHIHFANAGAIAGYLASRFLGMPWGLTLHGTSDTDYPAGHLLGAKIAAADYVACVSNFGCAQAMRTVGKDHWDKMFINRCGVDLNALPQRERKREAGGRLRIICVARLSEEKGHFGLLRAFKTALAGGADAELVLVGDGPLRAEIEDAIESLGLASRVQLLGAMAEQETLKQIARSDVLVLSSFMEGLPVALMEAMGLGLAVVAPRVAGVPELVTDGVSGVLFTPANWDDLASTLVKVLLDAELRDRLGAAGRAKVAAEFEILTAVAPLVERLHRYSPDTGRSKPTQSAAVMGHLSPTGGSATLPYSGDGNPVM